MQAFGGINGSDIHMREEEYWEVTMAKKEEFTFDSRDGETKLHAVRWVPEGKAL